MEVQGKVGPLFGQDGTLIDPRFTKDGGAAVQDLHGRYYESAYRGALFTASQAVSGVAPGTAFGTTGAFTLWNPANSGKNLVLTKVSCGYVSGTLGAGFLAYGWAAQSTAPTGGTAITPVSALLGNLTTGVGKAYTGSTTSATPAILRPSFSFGAFLATTAGPLTPPEVDELAGEFIVTPGNLFAISGVAAAGTTPLLCIAVTWEEATV